VAYVVRFEGIIVRAKTKSNRFPVIVCFSSADGPAICLPPPAQLPILAAIFETAYLTPDD
jgi:hypothetical protein